MKGIFHRGSAAALAAVIALPCLASPKETLLDLEGLDARKLEQPLHMKFCIYDPLGAKGDIFSYAKDLALEGRKWNLFAELKAYTDERIAAEDFKAGQCDGVAISTLRAKQFNIFVGSVDSVGSLPTYQHMRTLLSTITKPRMAPYFINDPYQVVGIVPLGAIYVMVRDRSINSVEKAAGKKVAVLEWDKSQAKMVQQLGAQPVASDVTNFAGKFNNGQVDIIAAPALAFKPLELYRGIGTQGAIYRFPLAQMTGCIIINRAKLLKQVPYLDLKLRKIREYGATQMETAFRVIDKAEKEIDSRYWMDLTPADKERYTIMMRQARIQMTREGFYDPKMMSLLKRIRCKHDPANAECSSPEEYFEKKTTLP